MTFAEALASRRMAVAVRLQGATPEQARAGWMALARAVGLEVRVV